MAARRPTASSNHRWYNSFSLPCGKPNQSATDERVARPKIESLTSPKVSPHLDTKETDDLVTKKPSQAV
uniref:Uncharacterized protein n=1 Tax=Cannabis sativa TaxID=3483 RepID=A0A803Q8B8_CANSA